MAHQPTPDALIQAVQQMHPDPFTQAAILRLWAEAPGLLSSATQVALTQAEGQPQTITDRLTQEA